jgi:hypothetical protein
VGTFSTARPLRIAATLILVTALLAGCKAGPAAPVHHAAATSHAAPAGATAAVDPQTWALASRLTTTAFTADTMDALKTALARSGIATYADTNTQTPERPVAGKPSPFRLLDFQAHALAVGAWAGSGLTGAELDMVVPLPPAATGEPTTSQLLAAYIAAVNTPGGALSRALMAGQNLLRPAQLRFPALVLVLFASDLAANRNPDTATAQTTAYTRVATGICSETANWINGMISSFFNALKVATPDNLPGALLASMWNWLVDVGQAFVNGLIKTVTDAVLGTIRSIAATIAATAEQIASLLPYAVKVTASGDGSGATFKLGPDPLPGRFAVEVTAGDLPDWPAVLSDCASVAKVALPDFHSKEKPLTWGPLSAPANPLLAPTSAAQTTDITDADGRAAWPFFTSSDPGDPNGEQRNQVDAMPVAVHRPELDAARDRLTKVLLGAIPSILQPFSAALFAPYISGLQSRLNTLLDARGTGTAILVFHDGTPPTPKPTPTPASACGAAPGTYTGTFTNNSTETIVVSNGGTTVDTNRGTGPVTLIVAADGKTSGTWSEKMHEDFNEHINITNFDYHRVVTWSSTGTFGGTACDLDITSTSLVMLTCVVNRGDCKHDGKPPTGTLPSLGPPAVSGSHLVWTWKYHTDTDLTVDDVLTISVSR